MNRESKLVSWSKKVTLCTGSGVAAGNACSGIIVIPCDCHHKNVGVVLSDRSDKAILYSAWER